MSDTIVAAFAATRLSEIHAFALERYKRERIAAGARVAPNRELAVLRALINRCLAWGKYEGPNPVTGVKRLPESQGRVRFLDADEEARLLAELPTGHRALALVGLHAGLRLRAEALTLRWAHVDLKRGTLIVQAAYAKSGKTRTVPLNSVLRRVLSGLRQDAPADREHVRPA